MYVIAGLGNPGDEYRVTRHNIGWIILENVVARHNLPSFVASGKYSGLLSEGTLFNTEVGVLLPNTFMNNSGTGVQKYLKERGTLQNLIVVHDDVDLPFGEIRISFDRGAGGHNGVRSIIDACGGTGFTRIRVGIAKRGFFGGVKRPKGEKLSNFVLQAFTNGEQKTLTEVSEKVEKALEYIVTKGYQSAMQEINGK